MFYTFAMKKIFVVSLSIVALSLSSCARAKNKNAIYVPKMSNPEITEITSDTMISMIDGKMTFPILLHLETCVSCIAAHGILENYVSSKGYNVYAHEITGATLRKLSTKYPDTFNTDMLFPQMFVFDKGQLTYTFSSDLSRNSSFTSELNLLFKDTNMINISNDSNHVLDNEALYFVFDSTETSDAAFYSAYLFDKASISNKKTYIIDYSTANSALINRFSLSEENKRLVIENGTTISYMFNHDSAIELINSYYTI